MRNFLTVMSLGLVLVGMLLFHSAAVATASRQAPRIGRTAPAPVPTEFHRPTLPVVHLAGARSH